MKKQKAGKTAAGKKNIFLFLSILAVVAVSGCVSLGDLFGSSTTTVEASSDVMAVSDSAVIPNPPILTGDTFTTSFAMKNLDEFEDAKNVKVQLYDWGVCAPSSCSPSKKDGVGWDAIDNTKPQTSYSASFGDVSPKDVQQIECQFRAPPSEKIGGIDARCPIRYKLTYDFSGITTTDLNVISNKKFQEMSRAGQTPTVTSVQSKSRGPIKVDFSFGVNQPVRTSGVSVTVKIGTETRTLSTGSSVTIGSAEIEFVGIKNNKAIFKVNKAETECAFGENINCNGVTLSITKNDNAVKIPMYIRVENKGSGKLGAAGSSDKKLSYVFLSTVTENPKIGESVKFGVALSELGSLNTIKGKEVKLVWIDDSDENLQLGVIKSGTTDNNGNAEILLLITECTSFKVRVKFEGDSEYQESVSNTIQISPEQKNCLPAKPKPSSSLISLRVSPISLKVNIPNDLAGDCANLDCGGYFNTVAEGGKCELTLNKKIDFVKDKSQIFRCELTSPGDTVVPEQKTYSIQSEVKYTYQLDNDFNVAIRPMAFG